MQGRSSWISDIVWIISVATAVGIAMACTTANTSFGTAAHSSREVAADSTFKSAQRHAPNPTLPIVNPCFHVHTLLGAETELAGEASIGV